MQRKIDNNVHLGQTISREFRRRLNSGNTPVDITYPSLIEKTNLSWQLNSWGKYIYWIPLRYLHDLGKINYPVKIDLKIHSALETEMIKLI